eukprot:jgi/Mesen1/3892/ME000208S02905
MIPEGEILCRTSSLHLTCTMQIVLSSLHVSSSSCLLIGRVLDKLSEHFKVEAAGVGAARIVEALLQLHLTDKEIESIFARNRPLYNATFITKASHASNMEELVGSLLALGLSRKRVGRLFKAVPRLLSTKDSRGWAEVIAYLQDELHIRKLPKVLSQCPAILKRKVVPMRAVVEFLGEEAGIRDVVGAVERCSMLLGASLESLREKAAALRELLGTRDVGPVLDRCPELLYVGTAVPACALQWLAASLGAEAAWKLVAVHPQFLTWKEETLERKLGTLAEMLPDVDAAALFAQSPTILAVSPEKQAETYAWLATTLGERVAPSAVLKYPRLLSTSAASMQARLEFVARAGGRSRAEVLASPVILTKGLESTLQPRFDALRRLGLTHHFALATVVMCSSTVFERSLERWAQVPPLPCPACLPTFLPSFLPARLRLPACFRGRSSSAPPVSECVCVARWQAGVAVGRGLDNLLQGVMAGGLGYKGRIRALGVRGAWVRIRV